MSNQLKRRIGWKAAAELSAPHKAAEGKPLKSGRRKHMNVQHAIRNLVIGAALAAGIAAAGPAAPQAHAAVFITATIAPPAIPVYAQPICPGDGYLWTPGYWAWGDGGYYWVDGAWVLPPYVGGLWTPGWWGWGEGGYFWHPGYWGRTVGYYGGINYGFGYFGTGFYGGYWNGGHFWYNSAYNHFGAGFHGGIYNHAYAGFSGRPGGPAFNAHPAGFGERGAAFNHASTIDGRGGFASRGTAGNVYANRGQAGSGFASRGAAGYGGNAGATRSFSAPAGGSNYGGGHATAGSSYHGAGATSSHAGGGASHASGGGGYHGGGAGGSHGGGHR